MNLRTGEGEVGSLVSLPETPVQVLDKVLPRHLNEQSATEATITRFRVRGKSYFRKRLDATLCFQLYDCECSKHRCRRRTRAGGTAVKTSLQKPSTCRSADLERVLRTGLGSPLTKGLKRLKPPALLPQQLPLHCSSPTEPLPPTLLSLLHGSGVRCVVPTLHVISEHSPTSKLPCRTVPSCSGWAPSAAISCIATMQHPHDAVSSSAVPSPLAMERVCKQCHSCHLCHIRSLPDPSLACCLVSVFPLSSISAPPSCFRLHAGSSSPSLRGPVILLADPASTEGSSPLHLRARMQLAPSTVELERGRVAEAERFRGGRTGRAAPALVGRSRGPRDTEPACFSLQDFSPDDAADLSKAGTEASPNQVARQAVQATLVLRRQWAAPSNHTERGRAWSFAMRPVHFYQPPYQELDLDVLGATRTAPGQHFSSGDFRHVLRIACHRPAGSTLSAAEGSSLTTGPATGPA